MNVGMFDVYERSPYCTCADNVSGRDTGTFCSAADCAFVLTDTMIRDCAGPGDPDSDRDADMTGLGELEGCAD